MLVKIERGGNSRLFRMVWISFPAAGETVRTAFRKYERKR
jgi:hypothetical protein